MNRFWLVIGLTFGGGLAASILVGTWIGLMTMTDKTYWTAFVAGAVIGLACAALTEIDE